MKSRDRSDGTMVQYSDRAVGREREALAGATQRHSYTKHGCCALPRLLLIYWYWYIIAKLRPVAFFRTRAFFGDVLYLKKNLNASRTFLASPVQGEKLSKRLDGIKRQNFFVGSTVSCRGKTHRYPVNLH